MVPLALAADTISILVMEVVGNAITLAIPGAMDAGLSDLRNGVATPWCTHHEA